ncbi:MAG TPA: GDSL-type esterase/lipase family protein [Pedobacter sp.]|uniref:GDSL-type esterase/lipase family protein n=1 Tax=Pedobacter sp. TaxID=1411316 RepID=UPI002C3AC919|nr:GDSL-type esterase/lipase family protein [Pedobacter sp.]HMI03624.1 GDSL-type esterase/lipase family protein [Pedobacter sp.]
MKMSLKTMMLTVLTVMLFYRAGLSQEIKWDSTYRPEIYPSRVDLYRSFKHSPKDIVFLGNSITFWGEWPELLGMPHIKNRGIPGDTSFGLLDRLDEVTGGHPVSIFILIGINDIARNFPDSIIIRNYERMISQIKSASPQTKIFFQTMLPTNSSFGKLKDHYKNGRIIEINAKLKDLAKRNDITVIDLYSAFADHTGNLPAKYTFDGVHLNKQGYDVWVSVLRKGKYLSG